MGSILISTVVRKRTNQSETNNNLVEYLDKRETSKRSQNHFFHPEVFFKSVKIGKINHRIVDRGSFRKQVLNKVRTFFKLITMDWSQMYFCL